MWNFITALLGLFAALVGALSMNGGTGPLTPGGLLVGGVPLNGTPGGTSSPGVALNPGQMPVGGGLVAGFVPPIDGGQKPPSGGFSNPGTGGQSPPGGPVEVGPEGSSAPLWKKSTARISGLRQEITRTFPFIVGSFRKYGAPTPVITSGNDSTHHQGSLHYQNLAVDIRANNIPSAMARSIANDLKATLGSGYDVIYETFPGNPSNNHIHIEYDPK